MSLATLVFAVRSVRDLSSPRSASPIAVLFRRRIALLFTLSLTACVSAGAPPPPPRADSPPPGPATALLPPPPPVETATLDSPPPPEPAPPEPKERFDPSLPTEVAVPGDLVAQVAHAPVGNRRAIVYLHGLCGDVTKFRAWTEAAVHYGTVVALLGDDACKEPGRYKWGFGPERTDTRILAALRAVSAVRSAPLDLDAITLVGYSQGSARAEALVRKYPSRYPRAVLIAGPKEHAPASFQRSLAIAVVAGERDLKWHLIEATQRAVKAGVHARYFELPGSRHGDYGKAAPQVMSEVFAFLYGS